MAANYSDRAIRANRRPNPDLIEFSASLANTPAYFVSDQRGLLMLRQGKVPPRQRRHCLHIDVKEMVRVIISRAQRAPAIQFNWQTMRYRGRRHRRFVGLGSLPAMSSALGEMPCACFPN
jgi:hypothetical protein